jgi:hypothetical protein
MAMLFPPAAPALRTIAEDLEPMLALGGGLSADAVAELHRDLMAAAEKARVQEALAGVEDPVSRRLFALAGAVEKHLGQPAFLDPDDVALLQTAVAGCAEAMEALPEPTSGVDDILWDRA